ncbi:MAG: anti-sigma factor [Vulcanimicrobiota bacterium]
MMNCNKVRSLLSGFIDEELAQTEIRNVEEHIRECKECAEELIIMRNVDVVCKKEQMPERSEEYWINFVPRLHERIFSEDMKRRQSPWFNLAFMRYAFAFATLIVIAGAGFIFGVGRTPEIQQEARITTPLVYVSNTDTDTIDRNTMVRNYLTKSEIVLIRLVSMPEQKEQLDFLKREISKDGLIEQIQANKELFKNDPGLLSHVKSMEVVTIKIENTDEDDKGENIRMLKNQVIQSGLLQKTQSMKI